MDGQKEVRVLKQFYLELLNPRLKDITYEDKTITERVAMDLALAEIIGKKFATNIHNLTVEDETLGQREIALLAYKGLLESVIREEMEILKK